MGSERRAVAARSGTSLSWHADRLEQALDSVLWLASEATIATGLYLCVDAGVASLTQIAWLMAACLLAGWGLRRSCPPSSARLSAPSCCVSSS